MATQQISLRLNKALYLTALLLAASKDSTVTDVITSAMHDALSDAFSKVPADAKGHLAEMASRKDVDMVDAKVSIRLASAGVPATYEVGTLFTDLEDEDDDSKSKDKEGAAGQAGKPKGKGK